MSGTTIVMIIMAVLAIIALVAVFILRPQNPQRNMPPPVDHNHHHHHPQAQAQPYAVAAALQNNPMFMHHPPQQVQVGGAGAGADAGANPNPDGEVAPEYMEADPGQTALYDNKLVPGARGHIPPEVRMLHQQIHLDGDYVDVEGEEMQRRLQQQNDNVQAAEYAGAAIGGGGSHLMYAGGGGGGRGDGGVAAAQLHYDMGVPENAHRADVQQEQPHCAYLRAGAGEVKCEGKVVRGCAYCAKHSCERKGCGNGKSSQARLCAGCSGGGGSAGAKGGNGAGSGGGGGKGNARGGGKHQASVYLGFEDAAISTEVRSRASTAWGMSAAPPAAVKHGYVNVQDAAAQIKAVAADIGPTVLSTVGTASAKHPVVAKGAGCKRIQRSAESRNGSVYDGFGDESGGNGSSGGGGRIQRQSGARRGSVYTGFERVEEEV
jgi:hypothetical protein